MKAKEVGKRLMIGLTVVSLSAGLAAPASADEMISDVETGVEACDLGEGEESDIEGGIEEISPTDFTQTSEENLNEDVGGITETQTGEAADNPEVAAEAPLETINEEEDFCVVMDEENQDLEVSETAEDDSSAENSMSGVLTQELFEEDPAEDGSSTEDAILSAASYPSYDWTKAEVLETSRLGQHITISCATYKSPKIYAFTPAKSQVYAMVSYGDWDLEFCGAIYQSDGTRLPDSGSWYEYYGNSVYQEDSSPSYYGEMILGYMEAGETYYITAYTDKGSQDEFAIYPTGKQKDFMVNNIYDGTATVEHAGASMYIDEYVISAGFGELYDYDRKLYRQNGSGDYVEATVYEGGKGVIITDPITEDRTKLKWVYTMGGISKEYYMTVEFPKLEEDKINNAIVLTEEDFGKVNTAQVNDYIVYSFTPTEDITISCTYNEDYCYHDIYTGNPAIRVGADGYCYDDQGMSVEIIKLSSGVPCYLKLSVDDPCQISYTINEYTAPAKTEEKTLTTQTEAPVVQTETPAVQTDTPADSATDTTTPSTPAVVPQTEQISISHAPARLKAKAKKKGKVTLSWKGFKVNRKTKKEWKNISKIEVQYSQDPTFSTGTFTKTVGKKKTKVTLKKLGTNATWYVRIRYRDRQGGVSEWSAAKKIKTKKR